MVILSVAYLKLISVSLIWAGSWLAGRIIAEAQLPPFRAASLRFLFGVAGFALLLWLRHRRSPVALPPRDRWLALFGMAFTGIILYNVCFFYGLRYVPAGRASIIVATNPSFLLLASAAFLGERLSAPRLLAVVLAFAGALLALTQGNFAAFFRGGVSFGDFVIFGCVLGWSLYTLIGRYALRTVPALPATAYSTFLGAASIWILDAILSPAGTPFFNYPTAVWISTAFLGLLGTTVAFSWYLDAVGELGASRAGTFLNLVPVFAVLLSVAFLGEPLTQWTMLAAALVLSGILIMNRAAAK